jgi:hypothetical protein
VNRRIPNGTYGGVRGRGLAAPSYSIDAMVFGNKDRDKIVGIMSKETGVDADTFVKMYPPLLDGNGRIPVNGVAGDLKWYVQHELVKQAPDINKLIDESFADNAVKQIGSYDKH